MKHRLLILGSLDEFIQLVLKAKSRGYYVVVCDGYPYGPAKKYADVSYNINVNNVDEIVEMCRREKIDGIIGSFSDLLFEKITEIAEIANLKWYVRPESLKYYRKKNIAKDLMNEIGIRTPQHVTLNRYFENLEVYGLHFPLVIKPIDGYGSKGIYIVNSVSEIREKYNKVVDRFGGDAIIAEEYSDGHEYNMMAWLVNGNLHVISIADRDRNPQSGELVPLLNRVAYPAKDIRKVYDEACDILKRFADTTGQKNGPLSMQFFYNSHGVVVCEIAARLFGYEHELVTYCSGLDIEKLLLDYVYDERSLVNDLQAHNPFFNKYYAGLYFVAKHGETVSDMSIAVELQNDLHVVDSILFYNEGDMVDNYSSKPYFARYYITAATREELDCVTDRFFQIMKVKSINDNNIVNSAFLEKY